MATILNLLPKDLCHKERPAHERQSIEEDDPTEKNERVIKKKEHVTKEGETLQLLICNNVAGSESEKANLMLNMQWQSASCRANLVLWLFVSVSLLLSLSSYLSSPDVEYAVAKCKLQGESGSLARNGQGCNDPCCRCSQAGSNLVHDGNDNGN